MKPVIKRRPLPTSILDEESKGESLDEEEDDTPEEYISKNAQAIAEFTQQQEALERKDEAEQETGTTGKIIDLDANVEQQAQRPQVTMPNVYDAPVRPVPPDDPLTMSATDLENAKRMTTTHTTVPLRRTPRTERKQANQDIPYISHSNE